MKFSDIPTPAYVCDAGALMRNLCILDEIEIKSDAKVLCALKGFSFSPAMKMVAEVLSGATCSGL